MFWYSYMAAFPSKRGMGAHFLLFWLSPFMCIPEALKKVADFRARLKTYFNWIADQSLDLYDFWMSSRVLTNIQIVFCSKVAERRGGAFKGDVTRRLRIVLQSFRLFMARVFRYTSSVWGDGESFCIFSI